MTTADRRPRCERCGGLKALRARRFCRKCEIELDPLAESGAGSSRRVAVPRVDLRWRLGTAIVHCSDWLDERAFHLRKTGHRIRMKGRS